MIDVRIVGDLQSLEYEAARTLKRIIERDITPHDPGRGQVLIVVAAQCFGQQPQDIDLVVIGQFSGLRRKLWTRLKQDGRELDYAERYINVSNFCFCIEVKDHSPEYVEFQGSTAWVRYQGQKPRATKSATKQSEEQKYSLMKYLKQNIDFAPYICNFIWFRNLPLDFLPRVSNNWLPSDLSLDLLLQLACEQHLPRYSIRNGIGGFYFSSAQGKEAARAMSEFERVFSLFESVKKNLGKLTRARLEKVTKKLLREQQYAAAIGKTLVSIEGRAGTGKTIKLLSIAHDLCVDRDQRCLVLTYNKALVSDIRRLLALAGISSDLDGGTIEVSTVHAFLRSLMIGFGLIDSCNDDDFLDQYEPLKQQLLDFLKGGAITTADIQDLMKERHEDVAWDTLLIDEAQDWPEDEKEILFTIFNPQNFVIADGIDQLVRSTRRTDWKSKVDVFRTYEKRSLRQKANLCRFQAKYADRVNLNWELEPSDDLIGGRVIILAKPYNQAVHHQLFAECEVSGNKPYEMLFVVPPCLVTDLSQGGESRRRFSLAEQWKKWGIQLWDGTSGIHRSEFPTNVDEFRVVQYDSCRGLEGWTVVCLQMDDFFEYKKRTYTEEIQEGQLRLGLQSEDEKRLEFSYKWSMIPLTRAIDTLVITLRNPNSAYARLLREVADQCKDFVEWIE